MTADLEQFPVPPLRYGATERTVGTYSHALVKRGYTVDLIAKKGSVRFNGERYTPPHATAAYWRRAVCKLWYQPVSLWAARHADVVHCHSRIDYLVSLLATSIPVAIHFHNDARQDHVDWILARRRKNIRLVAISHSQVEHIKQKEFFDVVYSVPELSRFPYQSAATQPPYLVYLGRVNYNKGADIAIRVAKQTGMPLKIVGPVRDEPGNREFYEEKILPFLDAERVHVGEVSEEEKLRILAGATAFIFPMRWREPMGIVMMESLACGTPVIVSNRASAPELIRHGRTGFLCESESDFEHAVGRIGEISRRECRAEAEARFDVARMIDQIEEVYLRAGAPAR